MKNKKKLLLILSIIPLIASCGINNPSDSVSSEHPNTASADSSFPSESSTSESDATSESSSRDSDVSSDTSKESDTASDTSKDSDTDSKDTDTDTDDKDKTNLRSEWKSLDLNTYGNTFRAQLQALIKATGSKTISYKDNNSVLSQSDKASSGSGVVPFYHADTYSTTDWNKEHVWPNSRGAGKTGPGADPHMLRPTISTENSSRSNYFYGNGGSDGSNTWDPATFGYEPARGEAARIIFYCATRYYKTCGTGGTSKGSAGLELSNNPSDNKDLHTMGRLDRLIEWNNKYPVTEQEKKRNEYLYSNNFGRNPFIDHPELANYIWDVSGIRSTKYTGTISSSGDSTDTDTGKTDTEYTYEYDVVTDLSKLSTYDSLSVIATDNSVTAAMKDEPLNASREWYLASETVTLVDNKIKTNSKLVEYEVEKNSSGQYTFKTGEKYLYHYISASHYSIGLSTSTTPENGSIYFDITNNNGALTVKGTLGVYLDFQSSYSTFSGSSSSNSKIKLVYRTTNA